MIICAVISQVLSARAPFESKFALDHASAELMEYHVHGFGAFGGNGISGDSHGSGIVFLYGGLTLGPFHLYEILG